MRNVVILLQARTASMRFPAKVLAPFLGIPMLTYQVRRLQQAGWRVQVLVPRGDMGLVALKRDGVPVHQVPGDANDVLGRFSKYAKAMLKPGAILVRSTGDTPLVCPYLLGAILGYWEQTPGLAYLGMGPGWPDGLADYDVFTREALLQADDETVLASDREHVCPAWWKYPERYPQATFPAPSWVQEQAWPKLSIDTPDDLAYVLAVAQETQAVYGIGYSWMDVLHTIHKTRALQRTPEPMNAAYTAQVALEQGTAERGWQEVRYQREPRDRSMPCESSGSRWP